MDDIKHSSGAFHQIDPFQGIEIEGRRYHPPALLARTLGISPRTLARWNSARIGPPRIKVGKLVPYDVAKVPEWLAGATGRQSTPERIPARQQRQARPRRRTDNIAA
jgi:hypothetical protein